MNLESGIERNRFENVLPVPLPQISRRSCRLMSKNHEPSFAWRVGKQRQGLTIHDARVPAAMIKVQMSIDDDIDFFRGNAARDKFIWKPWRCIEGINLCALGVPFVACARLDQNPLSRRANQQRIHGHENAIAGIRGRDALPHGLWYHSKHCTAIEPESSIRNQPEFQITKFHSLVPILVCTVRERPARASNSCTAVYGSLRRSATSQAKASSAASPCGPATARSRNNSCARVTSRRFQC